MNSKDKIAIENLLAIASYMQDNSVLSDKDEDILIKSMSRAAALIDFDLSSIVGDSVSLGDIGAFDVNSIVEALKKRKNN